MAATFEDAPDVENVAWELIPTYHKHLTTARIRYLRRSGDWVSGGKTRLGSAVKLSARDRHLVGADFAVIVNDDEWAELEPARRRAVVDHELCHLGMNDDGAWCLLRHDVEEFGEVIARHGLWNADVQAFAQAVQDAPAIQLRLPLGAREDDESEGEEPGDAREFLAVVGGTTPKRMGL